MKPACRCSMRTILILSTIHPPGPGMGVGVRSQHGRRLHPVRHGTAARPRSRRSAASLRRDTRAQGSPAPDRAAALFRASAKEQRRRHMYAARTALIPAALLDRFESCAWRWPPARPAAAATPKRESVDNRPRACDGCGRRREALGHLPSVKGLAISSPAKSFRCRLPRRNRSHSLPMR